MGEPASANDVSVSANPCPGWCDPVLCTASSPDGDHRSAVIQIPARDDEACDAAISMTRSDRGTTLLIMEMRHDPDISSALGMSTEANAYLFSPTQADELHRALARLLDNT